MIHDISLFHFSNYYTFICLFFEFRPKRGLWWRVHGSGQTLEEFDFDIRLSVPFWVVNGLRECGNVNFVVSEVFNCHKTATCRSFPFCLKSISYLQFRESQGYSLFCLSVLLDRNGPVCQRMGFLSAGLPATDPSSVTSGQWNFLKEQERSFDIDWRQ